MNRVLRTGLTIALALGAAWVVYGQDYGETPLPPPPPAAPGNVPRAAPVPRAAIAPRATRAVPQPPAVPDGLADESPRPAIAPVAPEPPDAPEPFEWLDTPEPPLPPEASVTALADRIAALAPRVAHLGPMAFAFQNPPPQPKIARSDEENRYYERGQRDLERNRWDQAADNFSEAVARGGARADGALYWKAYALNKLGRRDDALAAIAELRKNHAGSRWLDDARALEIEVKQESGKRVNPESADDEDLKLMALNSFMNSDPERALPLLEKLLHGSQSPKIKERALFVLTQSDSPKARQLVVQMAKGGSNPDLQMKAVHYLGVMGGKQELGDVYAATNDMDVKRAVLHGLMVAGAKDQLLAAAKGEKNAELRLQAIHWLGTMGAEPELWQLYQVEPSVEVKQAIVHALFIGGKTDHLVEVARSAKEPELRQQAIHWLGVSDSHRTGDALAGMYGSESNADVKKQIVHALFLQSNGKALVEIARKETNMELKKQIVHDLSLMKSKEGTDYLLEILNK
jgi:tetratricopeptide (TPR) repeat protein